MNQNILFHADDFAANREISEHILDCCREGALGSLSILPNSEYLEECMELLAPYRDRLKISVHFNLAEGHCMAEPEQVPLLVDERGMFHISFFKVLLLSVLGMPEKREALHRQLTLEMKAQMEQLLPYVETLRIDSHQHYHMIPIVMKSILDAVKELKEEGRKVPEIAFVRIPAEPLLPFLKHPGLYHTYRPINLVKNLVLNVLNIMSGRLLAPYRDKSAVFFGILLSGRMDLERIKTLLPDFQEIARRKSLPLEVLSHPGGVERPDALMDLQNRDCVAFYLSEGRKAEKQMLMKIGVKDRA